MKTALYQKPIDCLSPDELRTRFLWISIETLFVILSFLMAYSLGGKLLYVGSCIELYGLGLGFYAYKRLQKVIQTAFIADVLITFWIFSPLTLLLLSPLHVHHPFLHAIFKSPLPSFPYVYTLCFAGLMAIRAALNFQMHKICLKVESYGFYRNELKEKATGFFKNCRTVHELKTTFDQVYWQQEPLLQKQVMAEYSRLSKKLSH